MLQKIFSSYKDSPFKKNFSYLFLGDIISRGIQFIIVVYLARVLTDKKYGIIVFALMLQTYLLNFVDFGLPMIGTREIAKRGDVNSQTIIVGQILSIRTIISIAVFLISTVLAFFLIDSIEIRLVMFATFAFVFPQSLNLDWVFQGLERMKLVGISRIAYQIITFGLILFFVTDPSDIIRVPIVRLIIGLIIPFFIIFIISSRFRDLFYKLPRFSLLLNGWKVLIKEALPLVSSAFLGLVFNTFDIFYLGINKGAQAVAWYNSATIFFSFEIAIAATMFQSFYPRLSRAYASSKDNEFLNVYKLYKNTMFFAGIISTFLPAIFSYYFLKIIFGPSYINASTALSILMVTSFVTFANHTFGGTLLAVGLQKYSFWATLVGAIVNVVSVLVLVPKYSLTGAAISRLLAEIASAMVHYVYLNRFLYNNIREKFHA